MKEYHTDTIVEVLEEQFGNYANVFCCEEAGWCWNVFTYRTSTGAFRHNGKPRQIDSGADEDCQLSAWAKAIECITTNGVR